MNQSFYLQWTIRFLFYKENCLFIKIMKENPRVSFYYAIYIFTTFWKQLCCLAQTNIELWKQYAVKHIHILRGMVTWLMVTGHSNNMWNKKVGGRQSFTGTFLLKKTILWCFWKTNLFISRIRGEEVRNMLQKCHVFLNDSKVGPCVPL